MRASHRGQSFMRLAILLGVLTFGGITSVMVITTMTMSGGKSGLPSGQIIQMLGAFKSITPTNAVSLEGVSESPLNLAAPVTNAQLAEAMAAAKRHGITGISRQMTTANRETVDTTALMKALSETVQSIPSDDNFLKNMSTHITMDDKETLTLFSKTAERCHPKAASNATLACVTPSKAQALTR